MENYWLIYFILLYSLKKIIFCVLYLDNEIRTEGCSVWLFYFHSDNIQRSKCRYSECFVIIIIIRDHHLYLIITNFKDYRYQYFLYEEFKTSCMMLAWHIVFKSLSKKWAIVLPPFWEFYGQCLEVNAHGQKERKSLRRIVKRPYP